MHLYFHQIFEGFGLPIIESINNECPVVCSKTPIFKEIGNNQVNYFDLNDEDSLIDAILKAIDQTSKKIFINK